MCQKHRHPQGSMKAIAIPQGTVRVDLLSACIRPQIHQWCKMIESGLPISTTLLRGFSSTLTLGPLFLECWIHVTIRWAFSMGIVSPPIFCWFHCSDNDSAILQSCNAEKKKKRTLLSQHPKDEPPSAIFEKWKYQLEVTQKHTSSLVCEKKKTSSIWKYEQSV